MRTLEQLSVLAAVKVFERSTSMTLAQPPHEIRESTPIQRTRAFRIRQGDETVLVMERRLMHAPHGPLPRTLQATADALTARDLHGAVHVASFRTKRHAAGGGPEAMNRP